MKQKSIHYIMFVSLLHDYYISVDIIKSELQCVKAVLIHLSASPLVRKVQASGYQEISSRLHQ